GSNINVATVSDVIISRIRDGIEGRVKDVCICFPVGCSSATASVDAGGGNPGDGWKRHGIESYIHVVVRPAGLDAERIDDPGKIADSTLRADGVSTIRSGLNVSGDVGIADVKGVCEGAISDDVATGFSPRNRVQSVRAVKRVGRVVAVRGNVVTLKIDR